MSRLAAGFARASPAHRSAFGTLMSYAVTIGCARGVNLVRERRRPAPVLRSLARRLWRAPRSEDVRVHHFLPGMGLAFATGAVAIVVRHDRREFLLSLPFGAGLALTFDEFALLVGRERSYWASEPFAVAQGAAAGAAAVLLGAGFAVADRRG